MGVDRATALIGGAQSEGGTELVAALCVELASRGMTVHTAAAPPLPDWCSRFVHVAVDDEQALVEASVGRARALETAVLLPGTDPSVASAVLVVRRHTRIPGHVVVVRRAPVGGAGTARRTAHGLLEGRPGPRAVLSWRTPFVPALWVVRRGG